MNAAISVCGLSKTFRPAGTVGDLLRGRWYGAPVMALGDITFSVAPGEVVCVMGANGAGKSTLLRILGGLLLPTRGRVEVAGADVAGVSRAAWRRQVTYVVGDERSFDFNLTGRQNLRFFAALHGLSRADGLRRVDALVERVGLGTAADRRFSQYSRGMRQRLALARGLLGDPEVLLLDEPTLGLDPVGARGLRTFLRSDALAGGRKAALVASNDPAEARALADRVLLLRSGTLDGEIAPADIESALGLVP